jgi:hypothetical protein
MIRFSYRRFVKLLFVPFFMNDTQDLNSPLMLRVRSQLLSTLCVPSPVSRILDRQGRHRRISSIRYHRHHPELFYRQRRQPHSSCCIAHLEPCSLWIRRLSFGEGLSWLSSPYQRNNRINALGDGNIVDDPFLTSVPAFSSRTWTASCTSSLATA